MKERQIGQGMAKQIINRKKTLPTIPANPVPLPYPKMTSGSKPFIKPRIVVVDKFSPRPRINVLDKLAMKLLQQMETMSPRIPEH